MVRPPASTSTVRDRPNLASMLANRLTRARESPPRSKKSESHADRRYLQYLLPDFGDLALQFGLWRMVGGRLCLPGAVAPEAPSGQAFRWASLASRRARRSTWAPCCAAIVAPKPRAHLPSLALREARARDTRRGGARRHYPRGVQQRRRRCRAAPTACASISPGSTRMPLIFIWWSTLPRYSSSPSARQRTRSPVR